MDMYTLGFITKLAPIVDSKEAKKMFARDGRGWGSDMPRTSQNFAPYLGGGESQKRYLFLVPPAQVVEHGVHGLQSPHPPLSDSKTQQELQTSRSLSGFKTLYSPNQTSTSKDALVKRNKCKKMSFSLFPTRPRTGGTLVWDVNATLSSQRRNKVASFVR